MFKKLLCSITVLLLAFGSLVGVNAFKNVLGVIGEPANAAENQYASIEHKFYDTVTGQEITGTIPLSVDGYRSNGIRHEIIITNKHWQDLHLDGIFVDGNQGLILDPYRLTGIEVQAEQYVCTRADGTRWGYHAQFYDDQRVEPVYARDSIKCTVDYPSMIAGETISGNLPIDFNNGIATNPISFSLSQDFSISTPPANPSVSIKKYIEGYDAQTSASAVTVP